MVSCNLRYKVYCSHLPFWLLLKMSVDIQQYIFGSAVSERLITSTCSRLHSCLLP
jgi:hypothetical protein